MTSDRETRPSPSRGHLLKPTVPFSGEAQAGSLAQNVAVQKPTVHNGLTQKKPSFRVQVSLVSNVTPKLLAWLKDLEEAIPRVISLSDSEAVHDLRVSMRRIRSLLRELRQVFGKFHVDTIRQGLKFIGDATNRLRDLEVLQQTVEQLDLTPGERVDLEPWLQSLRQTERGARERVIRLLESGRLNGPKDQLRALLSLPVPNASDPEATGFARKVVRRARRNVQRGHKTSVLDVNGLHELRISYKRLRYTVEALGPVLPPVMRQWAQVAKQFQSILGDIHDHDVATEVVVQASASSDAYMTEATRAKLLAAIAAKRAQHVDRYLTLLGLSQQNDDVSSESAILQTDRTDRSAKTTERIDSHKAAHKRKEGTV